MDFDFSRFSSRSFERFAITVTQRFLGPGLRVYGDGPDGAREASYEGKLDFPSKAEPWSGYTVIQAKFRQHSHDAGSNAKWLVREIEREIGKFAKEGRKLKQPDNYLLITNVRLSAIEETAKRSGGLAKIDKALEKFKKLGLKDFRVWAYDDLCAKLAEAEEIRRTYAAWTSPSDVLSDLAKSVQFDRPDFVDVMRRFLQRELRNQRETRLQQAGYGGDNPTYLEDVFVDLPFRELDARPTADPQFIVDGLARRSRERLASSELFTLQSGSRPDRFLLFGAPGQGKSTVSQFFAQLLRASLLLDDPRVSADTKKIVDAIRRDPKYAELIASMPRRYPLRIELPAFADAIDEAKKGGRSLALLSYIKWHISDTVTDPSISEADLRRWLGNYPFALLLDGLDEVPPSGNRSEVIKAITEFWDEVSSANADLLMVVTTRPQGYNDDLDPSLYTKLELTKLQREQAQAYATRLAHHRLIDNQQRSRVLDRFSAALNNATTAHLLVTPLQVAIMLALIDQRGDAPSDRWTLFHRYFNLVLEREQQKLGPTAETFKKWSKVIEAIHQLVGFQLHLTAEFQGGADAHFTKSQLAQVIRTTLSDIGHSGEQLERITGEIVYAATERLVLLVEREDEKYYFEVRSLQEFMAAAYLMKGGEIAIQDRLREIANKSHWRHVFQIAASKCFSSNDAEHHCASVLMICDELDSSAQIDGPLKSGARLALSLLEDGLALDHPRFRQQLVERALRLTQSGLAQEATRLGTVAAEFKEATENFLKPLLQSDFSVGWLGAWRLILTAATQGQDWAIDLADNNWPVRAEEQRRLLALGIFPPSMKIRKRFDEIVRRSDPLEIEKDFRSDQPLSRVVAPLAQQIKLMTAFDTNTSNDPDIIGVNLGSNSPLTLRFRAHRSLTVPPWADDIGNTSPDWGVLELLKKLRADSSAARLAESLEDIIQNDWLSPLDLFLNHAPWTLTTLVRKLRFQFDPNLPRRVRDGEFGDGPDWDAAERRWNDVGFSAQDLDMMAAGDFFGADVATIGMPYPYGTSLSHDFNSQAWLTQLLSLVQNSSGAGTDLLRWLVGFVIDQYAPARPINKAKVLKLMKSGSHGARGPTLELLSHVSTTTLRDGDVLDLLEHGTEQGHFLITNEKVERHSMIMEALAPFTPRRPALLTLLLNLLGKSYLDLANFPVVEKAAIEHRDSDKAHVAGAANFILLIMSHGSEGSVEAMLNEQQPRFSLYHLRQILPDTKFDLPEMKAESIALQVAKSQAGQDPDGASGFMTTLGKVADARRSAFFDSDRAAELAVDIRIPN